MLQVDFTKKLQDFKWHNSLMNEVENVILSGNAALSADTTQMRQSIQALTNFKGITVEVDRSWGWHDVADSDKLGERTVCLASLRARPITATERDQAHFQTALLNTVNPQYKDQCLQVYNLFSFLPLEFLGAPVPSLLNGTAPIENGNYKPTEATFIQDWYRRLDGDDTTTFVQRVFNDFVKNLENFSRNQAQFLFELIRRMKTDQKVSNFISEEEGLKGATWLFQKYVLAYFSGFIPCMEFTTIGESNAQDLSKVVDDRRKTRWVLDLMGSRDFFPAPALCQYAPQPPVVMVRDQGKLRYSFNRYIYGDFFDIQLLLY